MSLLEKLRKNSTLKDSAILSESKFFNKKDQISTSVPIINMALSGDIDGGLIPGLTTLAGPSRHFKTTFGLIMVQAYMKRYPESVLLFYDSEFGSPASYFAAFDIDTDRVIHIPIKNIEELKFDLVNQLENIEREDKVFVFVDSIGNLASRKEINDALDQKSVADMTRAKQLKSLFRIITPYLTINDIPMVIVNHTYSTMEMYAKQIMAGGQGAYYSSDTIIFIGRQQKKDGKELTGYNFIINVEKSRFVREKTQLPLTVTFEGGIEKYSGLLEIAVALGVVIKPKMGWYSRIIHNDDGVLIEETNWRAKDTNCSKFWDPIFEKTNFKDLVRKSLQLSTNKLLPAETNNEEN